MDEIIHVRELSKNFRVMERQPGWKGAFQNLFNPQYRQIQAVRSISFGL